MSIGTAETLTAQGLRLLTGDGVRQDIPEAARMLREAVAAGCARAAGLVAVLAASGVSGRQDWSEALDHLRTAARLGDATAREQLALLAACGVSADIAAWIAPQPGGILARAPSIVIFPRFIPPALCRWLISRGEENPKPSMVYDQETGAARLDPLRSNATRGIGIGDSDLITLLVQARIATSARVPTAYLENLNILRYDVGQQFAGHVDYLDPEARGVRAEMDKIGQRVATFLIYLNDDFEGGQTEFPAAPLKYRGRPGDAILFYNVRPDGQPDPDSAHAGLPPTTGRKWLLSQWIRDKAQLIT